MTFSDLDDAFRELERRADAAGPLLGVPAVGRARTGPPDRPTPTRGRAGVVLSAAALVAVAVGIGVASRAGSHHVAAVGNPPNHPTSVPVQTATIPAAPATETAARVPATDVPRTRAALIARFRSILGGTATFTVDAAHSTDNLIVGVLTSTSGTRGLYVLEVDKGVALCGGLGDVGPAPTATQCPHVTTLADGSQLKVDPTYPDGPPGGVMNDAILSRPDGWQISLYTANVQGKYEGAPILGTQPALTLAQATDVVTSPQWLAN